MFLPPRLNKAHCHQHTPLWQSICLFPNLKHTTKKHPHIQTEHSIRDPPQPTRSFLPRQEHSLQFLRPKNAVMSPQRRRERSSFCYILPSPTRSLLRFSVHKTTSRLSHNLITTELQKPALDGALSRNCAVGEFNQHTYAFYLDISYAS
jgi:hypothetical protein